MTKPKKALNRTEFLTHLAILAEHNEEVCDRLLGLEALLEAVREWGAPENQGKDDSLKYEEAVFAAMEALD